MEPYVNLSPERTALAGTPGCPQEMANRGKSTISYDAFIAQKNAIINFKYETVSTKPKLLSAFQIIHIFSFAVAADDLLVLC